MNYSPIALFVYKRPEHTQRMLETLMRCPEFSQSKLYIFSDGAKSQADVAAVAATRRVVDDLVGEVAIISKSQTNNGLANSVISGVTALVNEFGKVIVLEDDLVVSQNFLTYMNGALAAYRENDSVMQVSGYMFPVPEFSNRAEAIFLPITVSWGWATWKRAWDLFDPDSTGWESLEADKSMRRRFNLNGAYDYFSMLKSQLSGKCDSWAIRWYWSVFKHSGLVVFPPMSCVENNGLDGSGTHGSLSYQGLGKVALSSTSTFELPKEELKIESQNLEAVERALKRSASSFWVTAKKVLALVKK